MSITSTTFRQSHILFKALTNKQKYKAGVPSAKKPGNSCFSSSEMNSSAFNDFGLYIGFFPFFSVRSFLINCFPISFYFSIFSFIFRILRMLKLFRSDSFCKAFWNFRKISFTFRPYNRLCPSLLHNQCSSFLLPYRPYILLLRHRCRFCYHKVCIYL